MISDEERREVAERMRNASARRGDEPCMVEDLMLAIGFRCYEDGEDQLFARLADLIDRPTTTRHGKFRTKYGRETPCCEVCGYSIGDMRWGYCPNCGAEVVSDGDD